MAREVEFKLADGETVSVPDAALREVYEALWGLAKSQGAISTAVMLMESGRSHPSHRSPIELTVAQSAVLRKAVGLRLPQ